MALSRGGVIAAARHVWQSVVLDPWHLPRRLTGTPEGEMVELARKFAEWASLPQPPSPDRKRLGQERGERVRVVRDSNSVPDSRISFREKRLVTEASPPLPNREVPVRETRQRSGGEGHFPHFLYFPYFPLPLHRYLVFPRMGPLADCLPRQ